MKAIRRLLIGIEYLSIAGIVLMLVLFYSGTLDFHNFKLFLSLLAFLVCLFVFLNCTDDHKTPFEKLFRFIGWIVLLSSVLFILLIHESLAPQGYWPWLNTVLILGLFAAQLSEINEMKKTNNFLVLLNFLAALSGFVFLTLVVHGHVLIPFTALFLILGANLLTMLLVVITGKLR